MPLMLALGNQDLRERHWAQIIGELKIVQALPKLTFFDLMRENANKRIDFIEDISQKASGEALV